MSYLFVIALFLSVFILSLISTKKLIGYLQKKAILDHPNERSSHNVATPRGGGLVIVGLCLPLFLILNLLSPTALSGFYPVLGAACVLGLISWIDDLKNLGPLIRFATQIISVLLCLFLIPAPENGYSAGIFPLWLDYFLLFFAWVWFINLFNFMDGIDGISGIEISSIALGLLLISLFGLVSPTMGLSALVLLAATLGFLRWNWHKAQIFLGDVGSIVTGFLIGWFLILLIREGLLVIALLLPLYYLCDATWTLLKRLVQRKKIWQAHREHLYQHAVKSGMSHDRVVRLILGLNAWLILLSLAYIFGLHGAVALAIGLILCIMLLLYFGRRELPDIN